MVKIWHSNGHHKNIAGLQDIIKEMKWTKVSNWKDANIVISMDRPLPAHEYPNKLFLFGPHFSVFPDRKALEIRNDAKNAYYCQPSQWVKDLWNSIQTLNIPIIVLPYPLNIDSIDPGNYPKDSIIVYTKRRAQKDVKTMVDLITKQRPGVQIIVIDYVKRYKYEDYLNHLRRAHFVAWVGSHESQGFAVHEALATNVPIFVWDATHMSQEVGCPNSYHNVKVESTTVPYWDNMCGRVCKRPEDLDKSFGEFLKVLEQGNVFQPRTWIKNNLNTKAIIQTYWNPILKHYSYSSQ